MYPPPAFLPPANEVCEGYVFTGVCLSTGGVHGCGWGAYVFARGVGVCVVVGGHAWLLGGVWLLGEEACMVVGGMCGCWGRCAWLQGDVHGCQGGMHRI